MKAKMILIILMTFNLSLISQSSYKIALLKYNGGGDWYANPTSLPNLIDFCNKNLRTNIAKAPATVEAGSSENRPEQDQTFSNFLNFIHTIIPSLTTLCG